MTGRDVARMAWEQQKPPRLPVTLVGGGAWYVHDANKTVGEIKNDPETIAAVFVRAYKKIGHDLIWIGNNFLNFPAHLLGCPIRDDAPDSPVLTGTVIRGLEERHVLSADRVLEDPIMQGIIRSNHLIADAIGRETLLTPTHWGPLTTAARILGTDTLLMAMITDPQEAAELLAFSRELVWAIAERNMNHPEILGINISEPIASGDMISPQLFRRFAKPHLQELVQRTRKNGKYCSLHICGDTTPILADILEIRPDCFSLEAKVDLGVAGSVLGGRVCVAGNVAPTGRFLTGTADDVRSEAEACIRAWNDQGGYILTLGCDFPKEVPFENIQALMSFKDRT
jgi:uroporphyrinogen decarboxylase